MLNANFSQCVNASGPGFSNLAALSNDANNQLSTLYYTITPDGKAYSIRGRMVSDPTKYFCIDSYGHTNSADNMTSVIPGQCN